MDNLPSVDSPGEAVKFRVGDLVKFEGDRLFFTVRATSPRYTVLSRQAQFRPKGSLVYTVVDALEGVRGPANTIGQGWPVEDDEDCLRLIDELENTYTRQVSYRNRLPLRILEIRAA